MKWKYLESTVKVVGSKVPGVWGSGIVATQYKRLYKACAYMTGVGGSFSSQWSLMFYDYCNKGWKCFT